ncbi:response regulator transcription factor [Sphingomonas panacisoli]|uniref:Response regulator transcription factor n=1 Tax=Sphingomonas panacisoli TaxID=1813879 RepID=A0A5B8LK04_9SPHN|nr:response regulator transcription factor [Sphingomonas panacisoli]QDZ07914.1 response regulator transcription factor [Sphingomonas panacisoli]
MANILIVEDDVKTAREIGAALVDHGMTSAHVMDGVEAVRQARTARYDAIILDRMLPGDLNGLEVLAALRGTGVSTPVLILSALSAVTDRVRGLRTGGDDYLTKPFDFIELTARVDALIRRRGSAPGAQDMELSVGDLYLDLFRRKASRAGVEIDLLPREYQLLEHFMRHPGDVMTRAMIFERVWGYRYDDRTNVIDVHVAKLRRKLDVNGLPTMIETVRGSGYRLVKS